MAVETAHLPGHKNILKPVGKALVAAAFAGLAITGLVTIKNALEKDSPGAVVIISKEFQDPPPLRIPDVKSSQQGELPSIKEYGDNWFIPGLTFELKDKAPDVQGRFSPNGVSISGYLIATETNPDGSAMLAVEVPGKNGLFTQNDIGTSPTSVENISSDGNEGRVSGVIVWVRVPDLSGYSLPFASDVVWNQDFSSLRSNKSTNLPHQLIKYARVGDPTKIVAKTHISDAQALLDKNYKENTSNMPYEQALMEYSNLVDANASTIQRMLEDASKGGVSLRDQLTGKSYVISSLMVTFVPSS